MCGIAGIVTQAGEAPAPFEELRRMVAMLGHRGPDGYGLFRDYRAGLAHARLSLVGLANGAQPMSNEDGSLWLVCNGEIFNHVELRKRLEGLGHRFATGSDSEVIVHGFEQYGQDLWAMLNGQFAIALWDRRSGAMWLVRDRFGILPLHWARAGRRLVFASEIKALLAGGRVPVAFDPSGLAQVFTSWSAVAPRTPFDRVHSVRPGVALKIAPDLSTTETFYWRPRIVASARPVSLDAATEELAHHLGRAIALRLQADVPVGSYVSGGVDSSLITMMASRACSDPLSTFSVRFTDPVFDETPQQRLMAGLCGSSHSEILCGPTEIAGAFPDMVWHCETPLLRTAGIPLLLLSGLVRDSSMKAVLTGEGADEMLAGYDIFKEDRIRRFWARQPGSVYRPALMDRLYADVGGSARARDQTFWRLAFQRDLGETGHPFYSHLVRWRNTAWMRRFLAPDDRANDFGAMCAEFEAGMPPGWTEWEPLARAQMIEIQTFMSSYLLASQGDRVAMAHGVEVRYPFLDPQVVDFASSLPGRLKLDGLRDKVVLRRLADRFLPREIAHRPKKPYRAPTASALFSTAPPDWLDAMLSEDCLRRYGLVDPLAAGNLVAKARRQGGVMAGEREEMAMIGLASLQLLGHHFLDEFAARSAAARAALVAAEPQVFIDLTRVEASHARAI